MFPRETMGSPALEIFKKASGNCLEQPDVCGSTLNKWGWTSLHLEALSNPVQLFCNIVMNVVLTDI